MSDYDYEDEENRPEVIEAKGRAEAMEHEAYAKVLEARAKLHWTSQLLHTLLDGLGNIISRMGCLFILLVIVAGAVLFFNPALVQSLFGPR